MRLVDLAVGTWVSSLSFPIKRAVLLDKTSGVSGCLKEY